LYIRFHAGKYRHETDRVSLEYAAKFFGVTRKAIKKVVNARGPHFMHYELEVLGLQWREHCRILEYAEKPLSFEDFTYLTEEQKEWKRQGKQFKLTWEQRVEIVDLYIKDYMPKRNIGIRFGKSGKAINNIVCTTRIQIGSRRWGYNGRQSKKKYKHRFRNLL
jgi:hypothetical protein